MAGVRQPPALSGRAACRARHPPVLSLVSGLWVVVAAARPAASRDRAGELSPSRPITTAAWPAGRPHVPLAFPAPAAARLPSHSLLSPTPHLSVAPPNLQSSRDFSFPSDSSPDRCKHSRPSTAVRTVNINRWPARRSMPPRG
ncbi:hypothetical protein PAHAL_5G054700 [Panicum hallii]|uniref:Uncharacterized protein n=1 Tax=Panicum hallii TaxID=206008 RepID=A0A2S3HPJ8_9POAL|nr:hypothetical protein PAHAL_5G054700 [Panicum hallii]